eukprot:m.2576 g.2576  ORF g.2576 m.2576 type:complete len:184 (+) comp2546_c0_seq1:158-709(+)
MFTYFKGQLDGVGTPDPAMHVKGESAYGQFILRRVGHRVVNMEWPEDYAYKHTLRRDPKSAKSLGHTLNVDYTAYATGSSDVLSSESLYNTTKLLSRPSKRSPKKGARRTSTTTPFASETGYYTMPLPTEKRSKSSSPPTRGSLPPIRARENKRDMANMNSCLGPTERLMSVMSNTTPVFVGL